MLLIVRCVHTGPPPHSHVHAHICGCLLTHVPVHLGTRDRGAHDVVREELENFEQTAPSLVFDV